MLLIHDVAATTGRLDAGTMSRTELLRLMADEGIEWPLWDDRGPIHDPRRLGLSDVLLRDIRRWFDDYLNPSKQLKGLDALEVEAEFEAEALRLVAAIQVEVGEHFHVKYVP